MCLYKLGASRTLAGRQRRSQRGFTFVEIGLVMLILVLAMVVAGSVIGRSMRRVHCDRFSDELRTFAAAFQHYHRQHGVWPPASNGVSGIPPGMEAELKDTPWLNRTPIGGSYRWLAPYPGQPAGGGSLPAGAIAVTAFTPDTPLSLTAADLLYLDARIDDGNLATGNFRTGFNGWPVYLVSPPGR
jgi:type II secretory pathway pseudopilin PulG